MNENNTPAWLIAVQNKSWEPEIIISGLTLTFLFIVTDHIFNYFGMLIQEYAVLEVMAHILYAISIIMLTGLKVILIVHLILRGLWTALVGLSYVYPAGVNRENLAKSEQNLKFPRPDELVIKVEKICSLLFAFIFSTIVFFHRPCHTLHSHFGAFCAEIGYFSHLYDRSCHRRVGQCATINYLPAF